MTPELRQRIADCLGWSVEDTKTFSIPTLAAWVRAKDPTLADEVQAVIDSGEHLFIRPKGRPGQRPKYEAL